MRSANPFTLVGSVPEAAPTTYNIPYTPNAMGVSAFFMGILVLRSMSSIITPSAVTKPKEGGATLKSNKSYT